ncbi:chitin deacetylase 8-like [Manduca sexta]|uniref:chitin deacetylase 8-like n=1 Tax=Manduca sexta TaxID=7130 RepID=UPI0018903B62|nr:chitin deacetylase 8-like [Manduca sexta]
MTRIINENFVMKWFLLLSLVVAVVAEKAGPLPSPEPCDEEACKLPECRCSSTEIPGGLAPRDTPQFVSVTFDDGVNVLNMWTYRDVIFNRRNSNGCPAGTTFYVSHEYTNYQLINELYNRGYEIALHSISHRVPQTWWAIASLEDIRKEIGEQKGQIAHFANIPADQIKGVRLPFLQMTGNTSFQMMKEFDLIYDHSWPTAAYRAPGLWPYTLHYESTQECFIPPCPTASIPGPWVLPMITWADPRGFPCAMVDACSYFPDREDENAWFAFIMQNFERHYFGNRAPFGFYVHEGYIRAYPAVQRAFVRFLDTINNLNDVFMVNAVDIIEWVKNPVPLNEYRSRPCKTVPSTICMARNCGPLVAAHNQITHWIPVCNVCPANYPGWVTH